MRARPEGAPVVVVVRFINGQITDKTGHLMFPKPHLYEISRLRDALGYLIKTGTIASLRYRLGSKRPSAILICEDAAGY